MGHRIVRGQTRCRGIPPIIAIPTARRRQRYRNGVRKRVSERVRRTLSPPRPARDSPWPASLAAARLVLLATAAGVEVIAADAGVLTHGLGLDQPFVGFGEPVAEFSQ